jgi:hypothetical protein
MAFSGTISDFDRAGLFGLITADDGRLLLFNLCGTAPALRGRFKVGTRVRVSRHALEPTARALEVAPIDDGNDAGAPGATTLRAHGGLCEKR